MTVKRLLVAAEWLGMAGMHQSGAAPLPRPNAHWFTHSTTGAPSPDRFAWSPSLLEAIVGDPKRPSSFQAAANHVLIIQDSGGDERWKREEEKANKDEKKPRLANRIS